MRAAVGLRRRRRLRRIAASAGVGLGALALGACGSSDGQDEPATASSPVNIGVVGTFSGIPGAVEAVPRVMEVWAETVNADGGLGGRRVNVVVKDVGVRTGAGLAAVQSLIDGDDVAAIISQDGSDSTWVRFAESRSVPVISGLSGVSALASPNVFPIAASFVTSAYGTDVAMQSLGGTGAVGYAAEFPLGAQIVELMKTFSRDTGLSLPVTAKMSSSLPDYTAFCQQMKDAGVSVYLLAFGAEVMEKITSTCAAQGARIPQVLVGSYAGPQWRDDPAYDGSVVVDSTAPFFDTAVPGVEEYRAALQEHLPSVLGSQDDNSQMLLAWAGGQMVAAAASKVDGPLTGASMTEGLHQIRDETLDGLIPPVTYKAGQPNPVHCWFTWKIEGGAFASAGGAKPSCAPEAVVGPVEDAVVKSMGG